MRELLHPPGHRGPLIAAGAVVLTVGVALEQLRLSPGAGAQLLVAGALAATLLWLGLQARLEGGRPPAYQSVLVVCGLLALYVALLRLADVLGADFGGTDFPAGALAWTALVEAGVAAAALTICSAWRRLVPRSGSETIANVTASSRASQRYGVTPSGSNSQSQPASTATPKAIAAISAATAELRRADAAAATPASTRAVQASAPAGKSVPPQSAPSTSASRSSAT